MGFNKRAQWLTPKSCNSMFTFNERVAGWILTKSGRINSVFTKMRKTQWFSSIHLMKYFQRIWDFGQHSQLDSQQRKNCKSGSVQSHPHLFLLRFTQSQMSELALGETHPMTHLHKFPCKAVLYSLQNKNISDGKCQSHLKGSSCTVASPLKGVISNVRAIHPTLNKSTGTWVQILLLVSTDFTAFFLFSFLWISLTQDVCGSCWVGEQRVICSPKKKKNLTKTFPIYWLSIQPHVGSSDFLRWTWTSAENSGSSGSTALVQWRTNFTNCATSWATNHAFFFQNLQMFH